MFEIFRSNSTKIKEFHIIKYIQLDVSGHCIVAVVTRSFSSPRQRPYVSLGVSGVGLLSFEIFILHQRQEQM